MHRSRPLRIIACAFAVAVATGIAACGGRGEAAPPPMLISGDVGSAEAARRTSSADGIAADVDGNATSPKAGGLPIAVGIPFSRVVEATDSDGNELDVSSASVGDVGSNYAFSELYFTGVGRVLLNSSVTGSSQDIGSYQFTDDGGIKFMADFTQEDDAELTEEQIAKIEADLPEGMTWEDLQGMGGDMDVEAEMADDADRPPSMELTDDGAVRLSFVDGSGTYIVLEYKAAAGA